MKSLFSEELHTAQTFSFYLSNGREGNKRLPVLLDLRCTPKVQEAKEIYPRVQEADRDFIELTSFSALFADYLRVQSVEGRIRDDDVPP